MPLHYAAWHCFVGASYTCRCLHAEMPEALPSPIPIFINHLSRCMHTTPPMALNHDSSTARRRTAAWIRGRPVKVTIRRTRSSAQHIRQLPIILHRITRQTLGVPRLPRSLLQYPRTPPDAMVERDEVLVLKGQNCGSKA